MKKWHCLYDPIISKYHLYDPEQHFDFDIDSSKLKCPLLSAEDDLLIKSTRVRFLRNIANLPHTLNSNDSSRDKVRQLVKEAYKHLPPI